jgi:hypothetical protein
MTKKQKELLKILVLCFHYEHYKDGGQYADFGLCTSPVCFAAREELNRA